MKLLITGSSGFVGWNAARYFANHGDSVVGTFHTFPHYLHHDNGAVAVRLDLADRTEVRKIIRRFQPTHIFHFAALARPQLGHTPQQLFSVNVQGTETLAQAAESRGIPLLYLSTDLVLPSSLAPLDESVTPNPPEHSFYAQSKLQAEQVLQQSGGRWAIIRPSVMFGDGTSHTNSFTQFIDSCWARNEPAPLFTDQFRSFLFVEDLFTAIEAIVRTESWGRMFHCGGPECLSRAQFGLAWADACGVPHRLCDLMEAHQKPGYVGGESHIQLDCRALRSLGWEPRSITDGFEQILRRREKSR
ncbi:MAG: sugar nucleotide-binding protein [Chlorobi bacterium]|nr:MAG: dTDP-4-dehydrorhamnose reductase [Chlorobi bacterium OLB7]MBK8912792.1 sugar nucleotide-binding protein [Chlorobiota bacterium]